MPKPGQKTHLTSVGDPAYKAWKYRRTEVALVNDGPVTIVLN